MDRSSTQKINNEILDLNHSFSQIDLADMHTKIHYYKKDITYVIDIIHRGGKNPSG